MCGSAPPPQGLGRSFLAAVVLVQLWPVGVAKRAQGAGGRDAGNEAVATFRASNTCRATNIIPERAVVQVEVRAYDLHEWRELRRRVLACFEAGAVATGCPWSHRRTEHPYAPLASHTGIAEIWNRNLCGLGRTLDPDRVLGGASTDMGNVSQVLPAIHTLVSVLGDEAVPHHADFTAAAAPRRPTPPYSTAPKPRTHRRRRGPRRGAARRPPRPAPGPARRRDPHHPRYLRANPRSSPSTGDTAQAWRGSSVCAVAQDRPHRCSTVRATSAVTTSCLASPCPPTVRRAEQGRPALGFLGSAGGSRGLLVARDAR